MGVYFVTVHFIHFPFRVILCDFAYAVMYLGKLIFPIWRLYSFIAVTNHLLILLRQGNCIPIDLAAAEQHIIIKYFQVALNYKQDNNQNVT